MAVKIPTATELQGTLSVDNLKTITAFARRQLSLEQAIASAEDHLADLKKKLRQISQENIPAAMQAAGGVKKVELEDGTIVSVEDFITANIKEANRPKAHKWLRANKFGALIKMTYTIAFGMGEEKKASSLEKELLKRKLGFDAKEAVHAGTLRAFVREQLEAGKALPASSGIDVTSVPTSKITRRKSNGN